MRDCGSRANSAEDMVASLQNKVKTFQKGLEKNKEMIIDVYMDSDPFLKFMDDHDDMGRRSFFTFGWDKALETVVTQHSGMFDLSQFPSSSLSVQSLATASSFQVPLLLMSRRKEE